jgi:hypothetical protein
MATTSTFHIVEPNYLKLAYQANHTRIKYKTDPPDMRFTSYNYKKKDNVGPRPVSVTNYAARMSNLVKMNEVEVHPRDKNVRSPEGVP